MNYWYWYHPHVFQICCCQQQFTIALKLRTHALYSATSGLGTLYTMAWNTTTFCPRFPNVYPNFKLDNYYHHYKDAILSYCHPDSVVNLFRRLQNLSHTFNLLDLSQPLVTIFKTNTYEGGAATLFPFLFCHLFLLSMFSSDYPLSNLMSEHEAYLYYRVYSIHCCYFNLTEFWHSVL